MVRLKDYQFFRDEASYVVGQRALGAIQLARAEAYAAEQEWEAIWQDDPEPYDCEGDQCGHYHEVYGCILQDNRGNHLDSLWGIGDPSSAYRRVVEAELASNAMYEAQHPNCKQLAI